MMMHRAVKQQCTHTHTHTACSTKGFGLIKKMKITLVKTRNDRSLMCVYVCVSFQASRTPNVVSSKYYIYNVCIYISVLT